MCHKGSGNRKRNYNGGSGHGSAFGSLLSLPSAIVDEVLDPVCMQASDGAPKETLVCAPATIPLIWEAL